jgi:hypothetical protein
MTLEPNSNINEDKIGRVWATRELCLIWAFGIGIFMAASKTGNVGMVLGGRFLAGVGIGKSLPALKSYTLLIVVIRSDYCCGSHLPSRGQPEGYSRSIRLCFLRMCLHWNYAGLLRFMGRLHPHLQQDSSTMARTYINAPHVLPAHLHAELVHI